ncbi:MAG: isoprenylcysteine carboxylmethyltransferase family protein [Myxococcales bacterium]|nr:isoprenylcysteine carboxylmethyltransferase family protein [Myxococcales bacterium]
MPGTSSIGLGRALFRFRSFTPVPVLALLGWLLFRSRGEVGPGGPELDSALNLLGLGVALLGQALRFYTLGLVPEGTSGQGSSLEAAALNTRGPYAHVRNPLYLGNLGICLGLMLVAHAEWVYAVGLGFFFGEYFFIVRAEEDFLRQKFGPAFEDYARKVARWLPRLSPSDSAPLRLGFDVPRALKKEHNPFAAWASGFLLLLGWELHSRGGLTALRLWLLASAQALVLAAFAVLKAYKRGWLGRG